MTTTNSRFTSYSTGSSVGETTSVAYNRTSLSSGNVRIRRLQHQEPAKSSARRVLRRLKGFLVGIDGSSARVNFVQDDELLEYLFPASTLKKAGIRRAYQPFEMDEYEQPEEDGSYSIGYSFRPMAKCGDRFNEPLALDEDHQIKLQEILGLLDDASH